MILICRLFVVVCCFLWLSNNNVSDNDEWMMTTTTTTTRTRVNNFFLFDKQTRIISIFFDNFHHSNCHNHKLTLGQQQQKQKQFYAVDLSDLNGHGYPVEQPNKQIKKRIDSLEQKLCWWWSVSWIINTKHTYTYAHRNFNQHQSRQWLTKANKLAKNKAENKNRI